jgi:Zn-dependent alcohol dehydrogenase
MNAVQGARHAGAGVTITVDPIEFEREQSRKFGATHTAPDCAAEIPAPITAGAQTSCS